MLELVQFFHQPIHRKRNQRQYRSVHWVKLAVESVWTFLPNCISGYVGYEATWIDGIALAPANVTLVGGAIDTNNTSFFEAVTFGMQILY